MKTSTAFVLIVAILAGGIAALMARGIILSNRQQGPSTTVVVAAKQIFFGSKLARDNLQEVRWGAREVPEGSFTSIDAVLKDGDRMALSQIAKNEPVVTSRITAPGQKSILPSLIEPGMRAVTVRVDDVRGVAGFIMPGDRVDVALTQVSDKKRFTDILLQNAKVLAVDQIAGERQEKAQVAKAVTLEVTAEQGQKLILAGGVGTLSLILREANGKGAESARRITLEDLGPAEAVAKEFDDEPKPKADLPSTAKVQIIRGAIQKDIEVFRE